MHKKANGSWVEQKIIELSQNLEYNFEMQIFLFFAKLE